MSTVCVCPYPSLHRFAYRWRCLASWHHHMFTGRKAFKAAWLTAWLCWKGSQEYGKAQLGTSKPQRMKEPPHRQNVSQNRYKIRFPASHTSADHTPPFFLQQPRWLPPSMTQTSQAQPTEPNGWRKWTACAKSSFPPLSFQLYSLLISLRRGKGVWFIITPSNPLGDFAKWTEYIWAEAARTARTAWLDERKSPTKPSNADPNLTLFTMTYHVPPRAVKTEHEIHITKADFERLEETPKASASLWWCSKSMVV